MRKFKILAAIVAITAGAAGVIPVAASADSASASTKWCRSIAGRNGKIVSASLTQNLDATSEYHIAGALNLIGSVDVASADVQVEDRGLGYLTTLASSTFVITAASGHKVLGSRFTTDPFFRSTPTIRWDGFEYNTVATGGFTTGGFRLVFDETLEFGQYIEVCLR